MPETAVNGGDSSSPEIMLGPINGGINDVHGHLGKPFNTLEPQPGDREVALQTMTVRTPADPIMINNSPYKIAIDEDRLAGAINSEVRNIVSSGHLEPSSLVINLEGETLPPKIADPTEESDAPIHSFADNGLVLSAPKEINNGDYDKDELAEKLQTALNRDLRLGMTENSVLKSQLALRKFLLKASAIGTAATGEAIGIATSNGSVGEILTRGTGGAVLGALAVGLATLGRQVYDIKKYGTNVTPSIRRRSYKKARPWVKWDEKNSHSNRYFKEPIISLVPIESIAASSNGS